MDILTKQYIFERSQLNGSVTISGAKNSALRLLAASILTSGKVALSNFPDTIEDGKIHIGMLKQLGKTCIVEDGKVVITELAGLSTTLDWSGRSIRNTLLILGALLTRFGKGAVPLPEGCDLGDRKIDLHEMIFQKLGADVWVDNGMLCAESISGLYGIDIKLPIRSTGATENAIICGSLAKGTTILWNPHVRPEILDLIKFLRNLGAKIRVYGQQRIEIEGVESLGDVQYKVLPDNMEAITWLVGSVITGGDVEIENFPFEHLEVPMTFLRESGAKFYRGDNRLIVRGGYCFPVEISTGPYPGINSDMQPIFGVYGLCAKGESHLIDLRFPGRYQYAAELAKMGASYEVVDNLLIIHGGKALTGADVVATDLRAGIALSLAGLVADGKTIVNDGYQIDRGYDRFEQKMKALEGNVERVY